MKYNDTKNKAYMLKLASVTLTIFLLILTFAASGILLSAEPEVTVEETEGDTTESNPPMTGETEIVYERAPRTIRIIDIASISNPNGYYSGEETEYTETAEVTQTQAATQHNTSRPTEITESAETTAEETEGEDFKFNSAAALAVGTVFIIIVLFTAVVIFIRKKHPSLVIEKNGTNEHNSANAGSAAEDDNAQTGRAETKGSDIEADSAEAAKNGKDSSEAKIFETNGSEDNKSETAIDEDNGSETESYKTNSTEDNKTETDIGKDNGFDADNEK